MSQTTSSEFTLKYYRTFVSYSIPFKPQGELQYFETQGLSSFYIGYHDANGRLIQFVKLLLERVDKDSFVIPLHGEPQQEVFFRIKRKSLDEASVGEQIEYDATETATEFFQGRVDASGTSVELVLMRKVQFFRDFYLYDSDGKLKVRVLSRRNAGTSVSYLDEKGSPLPSPQGASTILSASPLLGLELTGFDSETAEELKLEIDSEKIPGMWVSLQKPKFGSNPIRLDVAALATPSVVLPFVETLYGWLTTHKTRIVQVKLHSGNRRADASLDNFDRKKYVELFSEISDAPR